MNLALFDIIPEQIDMEKEIPFHEKDNVFSQPLNFSPALFNKYNYIDMIQPLQKYRNVTTGRLVEVEKVYDSRMWGQSIVAYIRLPDFKGFIKPLYVFEKSYKLIKRKKV